RADEIVKSAMMWDVLGGVARRAWARCDHAVEVGSEVNGKYPSDYHITLPYVPKEDLVSSVVEKAWKEKNGGSCCGCKCK
ncbi:MAG: hypothetical protein PHU72_00440, partial [Dethiosulfovibrio sp.]|nr:hypothetical protein [Dethiosulfovibrio sp.]